MNLGCVNMNCISQALKAGHYPKVMILSEDECVTLMDHFHTKWEFDEVVANLYRLFNYKAFFYVYYMTRKGDQKKCLVLMQ